MYGFAANTPVHPTVVASSAVEFGVCFVLFVLFGSAFSDLGLFAVAAVAAIGIYLMFRNPLRRAKEENVSQFGRYYCDKCFNHFEGVNLRRLTQNG
jgi:hypothetical protein